MSSIRADRAADAVAFTDVVRRYGDVLALDQVSFTVRRGETVALLGPNGAGKSTAVDLLLGLRVPDSGAVRVLGLPPAEATAAGRVGGMLQQCGLPSGARVGEVVDLARRLYGGVRGLAGLLHLAGITDLARRPVDRLSGGEAQRVRFALALAGDPDLLFLDEATVALDVRARRAFWDSVRAVAAGGTTVLFTTHYVEEAEANADRVIVLDRGRVVADGSPAEVRSLIAGRTVRVRLDRPDAAALRALPGVVEVSVRGDEALLHSCDADATVAALYAGHGPVRDLRVTGAGLEDVLLALTEPAQSTPTASPRSMP